MHTLKTVGALLAAGSLLVTAGVALASTEASKATEGSKVSTAQTTQGSEVRRVRGEVKAVEPSANPMTLTMKAMEGKQELTVGVDVTDKTIIREGKTQKALTDIKVGDQIWMKYERTNNTLVADFIRILKPTHVAAKAKRS